MIESYDFGDFTIDGAHHKYDIKLINYQIKPWQTRKGHVLTFADIKELLEEHPETLIIGTGYSGLLEVPDDIRTAVKSEGIKLVITNTREACKVYNELEAQGKKVCAIMHGTC